LIVVVVEQETTNFFEEFRNRMASSGKGKRVSLDETNFMRQFRDEESR
jgi:hypothetical protein